jgi:hypothetical protein
MPHDQKTPPLRKRSFELPAEAAAYFDAELSGERTYHLATWPTPQCNQPKTDEEIEAIVEAGRELEARCKREAALARALNEAEDKQA